jgi:hypothetical protein
MRRSYGTLLKKGLIETRGLKSTATKCAIPTGFSCKHPVEKDVGNGQSCNP